MCTEAFFKCSLLLFWLLDIWAPLFNGMAGSGFKISFENGPHDNGNALGVK